ncbi:YigZ family protein [Desulforhopalus sp. IMCC35007]|uniref:IMPACT family protein n=1 Tax=Desulforhopalus sp. IMCC35007 TaxID=2569543 RepID=UPI0010ADB959|nr:YigZ family protein [Desulforhopalus sp. IMCC35007]TKB10698.1 YigZ family protein [Desulforhopalus sp. IMCC35007]
MDTYYTPGSAVQHIAVEKKSKFITFLTEVKTKEDALVLLENISSREVGASHNCYAYIIGDPHSPVDIHCSDDGEPTGTAGRPLLNILLHENIGNVLVVITRYFGGVKLGSGGLVRAYSGGLKAALGEVVLKEFRDQKRLTITFHYQFEGAIRRLVEDHSASIVTTVYGGDVCFLLDILEKNLASFVAELAEITAGQAVLEADSYIEKER